MRSPTRGSITLLAQFRELAEEFLEAAVQNRHHGFSNVQRNAAEIHKGMSKAYPCGAGLGLMGVATDGDVALCHRFAGSDAHKLGTVADGIDRDGAERVPRDAPHRRTRPTASTCWARPICSGGCYHEAHTRYGDTTEAEPALLRVDPRLDRHLPAGVRGTVGAKPGVSTQFDHDEAPSGRRKEAIDDVPEGGQPQGSTDRSTVAATRRGDVVALQGGQPPQQPAAHIPLGCSTVFSPGWEVDRTGGTAGLCQPVERDLFDCHIGCYWPAQVPDQLNHAPRLDEQCAAAQKDWRKIDLVFP